MPELFDKHGGFRRLHSLTLDARDHWADVEHAEEPD